MAPLGNDLSGLDQLRLPTYPKRCFIRRDRPERICGEYALEGLTFRDQDVALVGSDNEVDKCISSVATCQSHGRRSGERRIRGGTYFHG